MKDDQEGVVTPQQKALGMREFARAIGVSFDSVYRAVNANKIRTFYFGRRRLIPASELARVLAEGLK